MRKITVFIALAFLLTLCAVPVYANDIPPLPHAFYGTVKINNSLAPVGTQVKAMGENVRAGIEGNPIETTEVGKYGDAGPLEPKLIVQGNILPGATITFYVTNPNGTAIAGTYPFDSGETTPLDLSVTIVAPAPVVGDGVAVPAPAAFSLSNLSVKPAEVQPKEAVTITVLVANTGGTEGSYTVVLMINGVKEAEKRATIAAGRSETVSFTVSKEEAASYSVVVDGLSGSFTVLVPVVVVPPPTAPAPAPAPPPAPAPAPPAKPLISWPMVVGATLAVIVVALLIFFLVPRHKRY